MSPGEKLNTGSVSPQQIVTSKFLMAIIKMQGRRDFVQVFNAADRTVERMSFGDTRLYQTAVELLSFGEFSHLTQKSRV